MSTKPKNISDDKTVKTEDEHEHHHHEHDHEHDHNGRCIIPSKIGRNDPCSCGSGKKYKKCCLQNK